MPGVYGAIMETMHELSLLRGVVDAVGTAADGRTVEAVGLKVGARSGVDVDCLENAWPLAIVGSCCEHARLDITAVPATVWCTTCNSEVPIDEYFALLCPRCDTPTGDLRGGGEFEVSWVDVSD